MFNPYILNERELEERIDKLRKWLHTYPEHERTQEAMVSLDHALNAQDTYEQRLGDDFATCVINALW